MVVAIDFVFGAGVADRPTPLYVSRLLAACRVANCSAANDALQLTFLRPKFLANSLSLAPTALGSTRDPPSWRYPSASFHSGGVRCAERGGLLRSRDRLAIGQRVRDASRAHGLRGRVRARGPRRRGRCFAILGPSPLERVLAMRQNPLRARRSAGCRLPLFQAVAQGLHGDVLPGRPAASLVALLWRRAAWTTTGDADSTLAGAGALCKDKRDPPSI